MEQLTLPFQEEILKGKQEQHHQQLEGMFFYQTQVCLVCNLLSVVWLMMWYWNITYVAHLMQANHTLWTSAACCLKMKILFSIVSSLLAWRWKRLFLFSASYLLFEVCCKWRAAARFNVGRVCRERLNALPQTSYLSRISRIISVEKILSCGEISDFCKEFEQFMAFYQNLCRFCSKFVWRKSLWRKNDKYEVCFSAYLHTLTASNNNKKFWRKLVLPHSIFHKWEAVLPLHSNL